MTATVTSTDMTTTMMTGGAGSPFRDADSDLTHRTHRRIEVLTDRGAVGYLGAMSVLQSVVGNVREVTGQVHEGVGVSEIACTVSMTPTETDLLTRRLESEPFVISVDG